MKEKLIISAEVDGRTPLHNAMQTLQLKDDLTRLGVTFKRAEGAYKGSKEYSYVIDTANVERSLIGQLRSLAWKYDQACLLYVDSKGNACWHTRNGKVVVLGRMIELENYTKIGNRVFTTIKPEAELDTSNYTVRRL